MLFQYGQKEMDYLKSKDKRLAEVIERVGFIEREVDDDLFASVVHAISGQQISSKAHQTIWSRMVERLGSIDADTICAAGLEVVQSCGISMRKAGYILNFAENVKNGSLPIADLPSMDDASVIKLLTAQHGIGQWTAEMLLIFCLQRPDILSFGDLGLQRGLCMLHHHRKLTRKLYEKYRRRYSPYGSVASFYLWEIAGGALGELKPKSAQAKHDKQERQDKQALTADPETSTAAAQQGA